MVVNLATLGVSVRAPGAQQTTNEIDKVNRTVDKSSDRVMGLKKSTIAAGLGFAFLTSQSSIAGAFVTDITDSIGILADTLLEPFAPALEHATSKMYDFSSWFEEQPPAVKMGITTLIGAFAAFKVGGPIGAAVVGFIGLLMILNETMNETQRKVFEFEAGRVFQPRFGVLGGVLGAAAGGTVGAANQAAGTLVNNTFGDIIAGGGGLASSLGTSVREQLIFATRRV